MLDSDTSSVASARSEADVRAMVREIVLELAPNPAAAETGSDQRLIEDLEFHSLALLELAFTLEDEFDLPAIDEEAARSIQSVTDIENHVVGVLREKGDL